MQIRINQFGHTRRGGSWARRGTTCWKAGEEFGTIGWHAGWLPDPAGGGWVLLDQDGDGVLGARDRVVRFDGAPGFAIGAEDFPDLRFSAQRAGPGGERLVGADIVIPPEQPWFNPVLPATDILLGCAGRDTLIGLDGADFLAGGKGARAATLMSSTIPATSSPRSRTRSPSTP